MVYFQVNLLDDNGLMFLVEGHENHKFTTGTPGSLRDPRMHWNGVRPVLVVKGILGIFSQIGELVPRVLVAIAEESSNMEAICQVVWRGILDMV